MLERVRADLHVHTCLSPCADLEMTPLNIVAAAMKRNIRCLAICDHNSAENVTAVVQASKGSDLLVLAGMEVCSREEVHVLGVFGEIEAAKELQSVIYDHLPGHNDADVFGMQVIANECDEVVGFTDRFLIGATTLSVEAIVGEIHRLGGVALASHIDRESYSVMSQLGFIPPTVVFDALELTPYIGMDEARRRFNLDEGMSLVRNSDAHVLRDLGTNVSEYMVENVRFCELRKALLKTDGRGVCPGS